MLNIKKKLEMLKNIITNEIKIILKLFYENVNNKIKSYLLT